MIELAAICHRCPDRGSIEPSGRCACTVSGRDILDHAASGECPKDRFRPALVEAELDAAGYSTSHPDFPGNSPCCGGGRKT